MCPVIFDVTMGENIGRKVRFVADVRKTNTPAAITYSYVVSRESAQIELTIAELNGLDIFSG